MGLRSKATDLDAFYLALGDEPHSVPFRLGMAGWRPHKSAVVIQQAADEPVTVAGVRVGCSGRLRKRLRLG